MRGPFSRHAALPTTEVLAGDPHVWQPSASQFFWWRPWSGRSSWLTRAPAACRRHAPATPMPATPSPASTATTSLPSLLPSPSTLEGPEVDDVGLIDAEHGWALSMGRLFLTSDAGQSWKYAFSLADPTESGLVSFADVEHGWAVNRAFGEGHAQANHRRRSHLADPGRSTAGLADRASILRCRSRADRLLGIRHRARQRLVELGCRCVMVEGRRSPGRRHRHRRVERLAYRLGQGLEPTGTPDGVPERRSMSRETVERRGIRPAFPRRQPTGVEVTGCRYWKCRPSSPGAVPSYQPGMATVRAA